MIKTPVAIVPVNTTPGLYLNPIDQDDFLNVISKTGWNERSITTACKSIARTDPWLKQMRIKASRLAVGSRQRTIVDNAINKMFAQRSAMELKLLEVLKIKHERKSQ